MNEKRFNLINNIAGWVIFAIAAYTYLSTIEPTVSLWDCGEFIAGSYKLEVVHPPGAPFFLMLNHLFTMFASSPSQVPVIVNSSSALASAFTILFLFWTITMLARKIVIKNKEEISLGQVISVIAAGIVGALAYTWSDSFWFSAVEGEVYALSSLFIAIVFWLLLKWERRADEPYNLRWLILIAYLMGLSIGVHLLSLLALPVIAFVYYFRKTSAVTTRGVIVALIVGFIILGVVNIAVIKWFPLIASKFELLFVNSFGLPYWSGVIFTIILFFAAAAYGIYYTEKYNKAILNTAIIGLLVITIGFLSYAMVPIRSLANTPIDYSNPDNIFNLIGYLNREQYGERPLIWGPHFSAPVIDSKDGKRMYIKKDGRYEFIGRQKKPVYDKAHYTLFPRMGDTREDRVDGYKLWSGMRKTQKKPDFSQNIVFFVRYQLGHMYWRYFAWNFIGRQNDEQGHGAISDNGFMEGNWISGIKFIDTALTGPQDGLPYEMRINKARNKLYFLPFLLGLLGLFYHFKKAKRDALSTFMLFFITGILLVVYQNSPPFEPRERDYTLVGSFYVYAIWIGFGVLGMIEYLRKKLELIPAATVATVVGLGIAPVLMVSQEWNDHDRSKRYSSRDFGRNYLNSCTQNAVLYTNGDNDTYPLWYNQEVEGYRDDVRVVNLQLLMTDWYADQLSKQANHSTPIAFSLKREQIVEGTRDWVIYYTEHPKWQSIIDPNSYYDIRDIIKFIGSDEEDKVLPYGGSNLNFFPTNKFFFPVDTAEVIKYKVVRPELFPRIEQQVKFSIGKRNLLKNYVLVFDMLANNLWSRPFYFAITSGDETYLGMKDYFQQEGMTYRITPVRALPEEKYSSDAGRIDPYIMYDNVMNKFQWGNLTDPDVYTCSVSRRHCSNYRNVIASLGKALIANNEKEKVIKVIDLIMKELPENQVPYGINCMPLVELYYLAGAKEKADKLNARLFEIFMEKMNYYKKLNRKFAKQAENEIGRTMYGLRVCNQLAQRFGNEKKAKEIESAIKSLESKFSAY